MQKNMEKNVYICMYNWITMLYSNNKHNIAVQLYLKKIN